MAPGLWMKRASISSQTPSSFHTSLANGSIDSPMWKRGNFSRSRIRTLRPFWRRKLATDDPAGPPPATITSKSYSMRQRIYHVLPPRGSDLAHPRAMPVVKDVIPTFFVNDLQTSLAWYQRVLGFTVGFR